MIQFMQCLNQRIQQIMSSSTSQEQKSIKVVSWKLDLQQFTMNSNSNIIIPKPRIAIYAPQGLDSSFFAASQIPSSSSLLNFQMAQYFVPPFYSPLNPYDPLNIYSQFNQSRQYNTEYQQQIVENQNMFKQAFNSTQIKIQQEIINNQKKMEKRGNMIRLFECSICHKSLGSQKTLKAHIQDVHGRKDFKCPKCDYEATTSAKIVRHSCKEKSKLNQCSYEGCESSVANLQKHYYNVHKQSPCLKCHSMFVGYNNLRVHLLKNKICHQFNQKMNLKQYRHLKQKEYQKRSENQEENSEFSFKQDLQEEKPQKQKKWKYVKKEKKANKQKQQQKQKHQAEDEDEIEPEFSEEVMEQYSHKVPKAPITKKFIKKKDKDYSLSVLVFINYQNSYSKKQVFNIHKLVYQNSIQKINFFIKKQLSYNLMLHNFIILFDKFDQKSSFDFCLFIIKNLIINYQHFPHISLINKYFTIISFIFVQPFQQFIFLIVSFYKICLNTFTYQQFIF